MNINSMAFRLALSAAAVWMVIIVYQAYSIYHEGMRALENDEFAVVDNSGCDNEYMYATHEARETCRSINFQVTRKTYQENYKFRIRDIHVRTLKAVMAGLVPLFTVLFIVAFWNSILSIIQRYVSWLRNGSKPKSDG